MAGDHEEMAKGHGILRLLRVCLRPFVWGALSGGEPLVSMKPQSRRSKIGTPAQNLLLRRSQQYCVLELRDVGAFDVDERRIGPAREAQPGGVSTEQQGQSKGREGWLGAHCTMPTSHRLRSARRYFSSPARSIQRRQKASVSKLRLIIERSCLALGSRSGMWPTLKFFM